jgi:hypothetical protein
LSVALRFDNSTSMNPRHAGPLALVGWYPMAPPRTSDVGPLTFDESAPLSKWKAVGSYDSASDCNEGKKQEFLQWTASLLEAQQCIASDDPRLKEK